MGELEVGEKWDGILEPVHGSGRGVFRHRRAGLPRRWPLSSGSLAPSQGSLPGVPERLTFRGGLSARAFLWPHYAGYNSSVDKRKATVYGLPVKIRSFAHKGLKRLYEDSNVKGVPPETVDKLRKMFF